MLAEPGAVQVECVIIRHLLSIVLRRLGIPHDSVADGHSALELMREHHYDVLLLDLMMPVISGYELIEHLKQDAQRPCTIIVMSAVSEADLARLDPEIVTNVVHKPFDVDAVAALVRDAARAVHS
jgi:CheY-like chemotaxis protein